MCICHYWHPAQRLFQSLASFLPYWETVQPWETLWFVPSYPKAQTLVFQCSSSSQGAVAHQVSKSHSLRRCHPAGWLLQWYQAQPQPALLPLWGWGWWFIKLLDTVHKADDVRALPVNGVRTRQCLCIAGCGG